MADGGIDPAHLQRARFLMTQLLVLALPGFPAFYLPALWRHPMTWVGSVAPVSAGISTVRSSRRRQWSGDFRISSDATAVTSALGHALQVRRDQPALRFDAAMEVLSAWPLRSGDAASPRGQTLVVVRNVTALAAVPWPCLWWSRRSRLSRCDGSSRPTLLSFSWNLRHWLIQA